MIFFGVQHYFKTTIHLDVYDWIFPDYIRILDVLSTSLRVSYLAKCLTYIEL